MNAPIRIGAIVMLVLLAAYYALRVLAGSCAGPACEGYVVPSLLLPVLTLAVAAATGLVAVSAARRGAANAPDPATARRYTAWLGLLVICTALGVLGPIASAVIWRDRPDMFVPVATALVLTIPVCALLYTFLANRPRTPSLAPR